MTIGDVDLTTLSEVERTRFRRRHIGFVFQFFNLLPTLSVLENLLLPLELKGSLGAKDEERARRLLERVGLLDFVDKRADALSGGERQRVGIARAIVQEPELLLVDEPTASLDPRVSIQIMRLIVELCAERQMAAIINIHDVALARMFVDRIVGIRKGMIVFDGPSEMLSEEGWSEIYGAEQEVLNPSGRPSATI